MTVEKPTLINCRARGVSPACYHLREERRVYPDGAEDDGTYRESDGSVVCDPCYIALGQPRREDLEAAVSRAQSGTIG